MRIGNLIENEHQIVARRARREITRIEFGQHFGIQHGALVHHVRARIAVEVPGIDDLRLHAPGFNGRAEALAGVFGQAQALDFAGWIAQRSLDGVDAPKVHVDEVWLTAPSADAAFAARCITALAPSGVTAAAAARALIAHSLDLLILSGDFRQLLRLCKEVASPQRATVKWKTFLRSRLLLTAPSEATIHSASPQRGLRAGCVSLGRAAGIFASVAQKPNEINSERCPSG